MTRKTEGILFYSKGGVEFRRVRVPESFIIVGAVLIMTAGTIPFPDGPMLIGTFRYHFINVVYSAPRTFYRLLVTIQTKVEGYCFKDVLVQRSVGVVTIQTNVFLLQDGMLKPALVGFFN